MRALNIVLFGAMAVSAVSYLAFQEPDMVPVAEAMTIPRPKIVICEKPMDSYLSLKTPVAEKKALTAPVITGEVEEPVAVEKAPVERVQTLEDRRDAMLFEVEALGDLPFDQAVFMPFE